MNRALAATVVIGTIVLSACGGAGQSAAIPAAPNARPVGDTSPAPGGSAATPSVGTNPVPVPSATAGTISSASSQVPVALTLALSEKGTLSTIRRAQYLSAANATISVNVTPIGGSTTTSSGSCTTTSCSISFSAAPGPTTLAFTLQDASANVLSRFSTVVVIQPVTLNTIALTANPVVSSVSLSLAAGSVTAGSAANTLLTVTAKDAANQTIVGNAPYVDVNGTPVSLTLQTTNIQAGGRGTVSILGPSRITAPAQAAIYAHYDGNWLDHTNIGVAASSSAVTTLTGTMLSTTPAVISYPSTVVQPFGITAGSDGRLWFGANGQASVIGAVTTSGTVSIYNGPITQGYSSFLTSSGPDGNVWFSEWGGNAIGKITPAGTVTEFTGPGAYLNGSTAGPDGRVWFASAATNQIGAITPSGTTSLYGSGITCNPNSMVSGFDGAIWFTEGDPTGSGRTCGRLGRSTLSGQITEFTTGITPNSMPAELTRGRDGRLWFTEYGNSTIGGITMNGTVSEYNSGLTAGSQPWES